MERNSPDTHLYALGDHVDFAKPINENGIFALVLAKISQITQDPVYQVAARDTMARMV